MNSQPIDYVKAYKSSIHKLMSSLLDVSTKSNSNTRKVLSFDNNKAGRILRSKAFKLTSAFALKPNPNDFLLLHN